MPFNKFLKKLNFLLILTEIGLCIYLIGFPFLPEVQFRVRHSQIFANNSTEATTSTTNTSEPSEQIEEDIPSTNMLVIPQIDVNGQIIEGTSATTLNKGFWRKPNSSTPNKVGNVVITGHRFLYTSGPRTFYHLDKMKLNDKFWIYWQGERYDYEVFRILVVNPDGVEIESNTSESIITLYTCTPLWTAKQRLVVQARLIEGK